MRWKKERGMRARRASQPKPQIAIEQFSPRSRTHFSLLAYYARTQYKHSHAGRTESVTIPPPRRQLILMHVASGMAEGAGMPLLSFLPERMHVRMSSAEPTARDGKFN